MQAHVPGLVEQHGVAGDGGEDVAEADAPLLLLILQHNTTYKVSFTTLSKTALFIAHTPKVYFKRTFTRCISAR